VSTAIIDLFEAAREGGEVKARSVWDAMPVASKREIIGLLLNKITVGRPVHKLSRWADDRQRLEAAELRIAFMWREYETPAIPKQRSSRTTRAAVDTGALAVAS
jgi:hypothetical protein